MEPVLFRRGQYLQSFLLQKGKPLCLLGFPDCFAVYVLLASPLCVVEGVGLLRDATLGVAVKKSVIELCLEVPAVGSGVTAGGGL